jgi:uncharacterized protein (DUF4415 family)
MPRKRKPPAGFEENREWGEAEFARAKPFAEALPRPAKAWSGKRRPPVESPKKHIGFRLAADVVDSVRASSRGYNARVEKVLREALAAGKF